MNHWLNIVAQYERLATNDAGSSAAPKRPASKHAGSARTAMIFSPHPDDECIISGLALRLARETNWHVTNVAVTLGSKSGRRAARLRELQNACSQLGFELIVPRERGMENVNLDARRRQRSTWMRNVQAIADILKATRPRVVFVPHDDDGHATHIGTHWLVMDALKTMPRDFDCFIAETEFWRQMKSPNLLVGLDTKTVANLVAALSLHAGEVRRNPYHLRLPAWFIDNVRRSESVLGHGSRSPRATFGILHRLRRWRNGRATDVPPRSKFLSCDANAALLFQ
ncbi:MAG TPA: PIG-L family deacetylase [Verrucomicrobiota bacterium]|nr:PIG-L family deacetylase [Verrucomicrobiota bacterium]